MSKPENIAAVIKEVNAEIARQERINEIMRPEHEAMVRSDQDPVYRAAQTLNAYTTTPIGLPLPLGRRMEELPRALKEQSRRLSLLP